MTFDIPDGIDTAGWAATLGFAIRKVIAKRPVAKPGSIQVNTDIPDGIKQQGRRPQLRHEEGND